MVIHTALLCTTPVSPLDAQVPKFLNVLLYLQTYHLDTQAFHYQVSAHEHQILTFTNLHN